MNLDTGQEIRVANHNGGKSQKIEVFLNFLV